MFGILVQANQVFLTNLISFYYEETHLFEEGKAVDVIYLWMLAKPLTPFPTIPSWRN